MTESVIDLHHSTTDARTLVTLSAHNANNDFHTVCVFCGSSPGANDAYRALARDFGATIAARGLRLVYGGGNVGLMGAVADAALAGGGEVVGVIPQHLVDRVSCNPCTSEKR